jgi:hypothetical protein
MNPTTSPSNPPRASPQPQPHQDTTQPAQDSTPPARPNRGPQLPGTRVSRRSLDKIIADAIAAPRAKEFPNGVKRYCSGNPVRRPALPKDVPKTPQLPERDEWTKEDRAEAARQRMEERGDMALRNAEFWERLGVLVERTNIE